MFKLAIFLLTWLSLVAVWRLLSNGDDFKLPKDGDMKGKKISRIIDRDEKEVDVFESFGVLHTVPLREIVSGGTRKDGIPSIDNPKFISAERANSYLSDIEPGIAVKVGDIKRFYPFEILVWHQIVNDNIEGKRILISYCPLSFSAAAFDPIVDGQSVEFGASGKLWNSNFVMHDRRTGTLWSEIKGEAICGKMAGSKLQKIFCEQTTYGRFKKLYPGGEVLSRQTGFFRFYGDNPYDEYYRTPEIFFPVSNIDSRLDKKDFILGLSMAGRAKAYPVAKLKEETVIKDNFAGRTIVAKYDSDTETGCLFEEFGNGELRNLFSTAGFWFSWAAAYPETEVYK